MTRKRALCLVTLLLWVFALQPVLAQSAREVAQRSFGSVVLLSMADDSGQPISLGSGFSVGPGRVVTNVHVIRGADRGFVKAIGSKARYAIEGVEAIDEANDLVVLRVSEFSRPALRLVSSKTVAIGDEVFAVGNPQGLEGTISEGIVSGIRKADGIDLIQITAPISPGSSGGPVLNGKAEVIGIAVGTFRKGQNLNFAVPSEQLLALLATTMKLRSLQSPELRREMRSETAIHGNNEAGVEGTHVECRRIDPRNEFMDAECRYSIVNRLDRPVTNVVGVFIVWDKEGRPLDSQPVRANYSIAPGLATRRPGPTIDAKDVRLFGHGEVRILDFRLLD